MNRLEKPFFYCVVACSVFNHWATSPDYPLAYWAQHNTRPPISNPTSICSRVTGLNIRTDLWKGLRLYFKHLDVIIIHEVQKSKHFSPNKAWILVLEAWPIYMPYDWIVQNIETIFKKRSVRKHDVFYRLGLAISGYPTPDFPVIT